MTRKDYIAIAKALNVTLTARQPNLTFFDAVYTLCEVMQRDNPRFDRERFLAAVKGEKNVR